MPGQLSIIGGAFKGMKLHSPPVGVTRPLRAIVKKSLFDILTDRVIDAVCLDLFAGSGSIGLEAISRGAGKCVFVESNPKVFAVLQKNVDKIGRGVDNDPVAMRTIKADAQDILRAGPVPEAPVDIVFLDPPFAAKATAVICLNLLSMGSGWVAEDGLIVYQFRGEIDLSDTSWRVIDKRVFGEGRLVFLGTAADD
jgi:16S rRNA (guanine966-N2)-methyltransferase